MSLLDSILHATGAGAGSAGAFLSGIVYRRFRTTETNATKAKERVESLEKEVADLKNVLKTLESSVLSKFEAIARGSSAKIEFTLDAASLERIKATETRMSSLEDDFDHARDEDRKSWEAMNRSTGVIEGTLKMLLTARNPAG